MTDQECTGLTLRLRSAVEDFAIYFFAGKPSTAISVPSASSVVLKQTLVSEAGLATIQLYFTKHIKTIPSFNHYLLSNDRCPDVIQTFLWRVLVGEVFNRFQWAGERHA